MLLYSTYTSSCMADSILFFRQPLSVYVHVYGSGTFQLNFKTYAGNDP